MVKCYIFLCGAFVEIPIQDQPDIPLVQRYGMPIRRSSRGLQ